jgi:hypothetical protein
MAKSKRVGISLKRYKKGGSSTSSMSTIAIFAIKSSKPMVF